MTVSPILRFKSILPEFAVQQILTTDDLHLVANKIDLDHDKNLNILNLDIEEGVFVDTVAVEGDIITMAEEDNQIIAAVSLGDWFIIEQNSQRNAVVSAEYDENKNLIKEFDTDSIPSELLVAIVVPA
jgi:hypothetical protein